MYSDLLALFVLGFFIIWGAMQGFMRQLISLMTLLAIIALAHPLADWLKYSTQWAWAQKAPLLVLFVMVSIIFVCLGFFASWVVYLMKEKPAIAPVDRWLGAAVGVFKGALVALVMGCLYFSVPEKTRSAFGELNADVKSSYALKASQSMIEWKWLSSMRSLRQIKEIMKPAEPKREILDQGPWAFDTDPDSD